MSKLRSKFITVLAVLFCTLLCLSTAFIIPNKTANAARGNNFTQIGEIYSGNGGFDAENMKALYEALTGVKNATYETVKNMVYPNGTNGSAVDKTSQNIRENNAKLGEGHKDANGNGNNVSVTFGDIKWDVTYITTDKSGNIIVDLWQSADTVTKKSVFADGHSDSSYSGDYTSNMYTTSYVRVVTLNAGGKFTSGGISKSNLNSSYTQTSLTSENIYARFTSESATDSLTGYLVQPTNVAYQANESAKDKYIPSNTSKGTAQCLNDAYNILPNSDDVKWSSDDVRLIQDKGKNSGDGTAYGDWQYDYLWLPSFSETGNSDGTGNGIWETNTALRSAVYPTGDSSAQNNTWLRSGHNESANKSFFLTNEGKHSVAETSVNRAVRPAIHFNLSATKTLHAEDVTTTYTGSKITLESIYTANKDEAPWYIPAPSVYSTDINYSYKLNGSDSPEILNAGTYEVTMTFKANTSYNYKWDANSNYSKIKIVVNKKKVNVKFTSQAEVTSGVEAEYPTVAYAANQLARADEENGSRGATHYPKLQIRYINADPLTDDYDSTDKPTLPGKYYAIAEIDTEDAAENNKIINYEIITEGGADRISFEVKPVEVKNPAYSGTLTYSGLEQTVNIDNKDGLSDGLIKYTVTKKNGDVVTEKGGKELKDITDDSFKIIDAGEYNVTFTFVDKDVKDTHVWNDSGKNDDYKLTFEVKKKTLDFTLNSSSSDFANNSWKAQTAMPFTVNVAGECEQEKVELVVTYTDKEGVNESVLDDSGNRSYSIPALDTGTKYKLYIKLSDADINKNYEIKYNGSVTERIEKAFTITAAKVNFGDDDLVWVYVNTKEADGDEQSIVSGDELTYNGEEFKVSLKRDELTQYGLMVDTDFAPPTGLDGVLSATYVGTYTVKVRIKAVSAEYEFETKVFTFEWKIKKATYDLSKITKLEWSYVARGDEMGEYPSDGIQYEGGDDMGPDGLIKIYVSGGLPDGLEVDLADIRYNEYYEIGDYVAVIQKLKNTDTTNYEDAGDISGYDWATFDWKIVKRILDSSAEFWTETVEYDAETCKVTQAPELKTAPYNPKLYYRYFETADCSGTALELKDLEYVEGKTKTYWVRAYIVDTDEENVKHWGVDPENKFEFKVGETKIAVELKVTAGGEYDGTPKGATLSIVGNIAGIDTGAFELTYYSKSNLNNALADGAPTNAGSYRVTIALKAGYSGYYIKSDKFYDFTIDTRKLTVPPQVMDNLTYDGTERDVAAVAGLPEGWENYISINIKSLTNGIAHPAGSTIRVVADYEVSFSIKEGINTGTPNNVEWNDGSKTPKKMKISIVKLVLHAEDWVEADYDSYIVFTENNGRNFVVYTVTDINGKTVDRATVEDSENESFTVTVTIAEEHIGNVEFVFADGVSNKYEFFTSGALPPVKVKLPTIADLTFNGENQTFTVDYGEFEQYIEIDLSLSDISVLSQFNAGEYTVYFKIKSGVNAVWATTGERKAVAVTFKMKVLVLDEPQVKSGERFTYNGSEQSATLNIDAAILARFMKIEGDYKATNAGDYSFTLSIDPSFAGNVVWASAQGIDAVKTVDWTIEKARVSVKWTQSGDVPELDIPEEFKDLDVEYEITDENGNVVSPDQMEAGKTYTVTAKLKEGSAANYEFVDDNGKTLANPASTGGLGFEFKGGGSSFPWWIIALIAVLLIATAAVIVIVVKKRQTADGDDEFDDYYGDDYDYDDEEIEEDEFDEDF